MPWAESSRPYPDVFTPPKGSSGYDVVIPFTNTAPAAMSRTKRSCSAGSFVQTLEPRPNTVALASSSASSTLDTRYIWATGPKTSSENMRIFGVMSVTTVAG